MTNLVQRRSTWVSEFDGLVQSVPEPAPMPATVVAHRRGRQAVRESYLKRGQGRHRVPSNPARYALVVPHVVVIVVSGAVGSVGGLLLAVVTR